MDTQAPSVLTTEPQIQNSNPKTPTDNHWVTITAMALFVLLSLSAVAFLYYQNQKLKTMLASYQQVQTTPIPSATPNPTANWKTYTDPDNKYSFKYPQDFAIDFAVSAGALIRHSSTGEGSAIKFMTIQNTKQSGLSTSINSIYNTQLGSNHNDPNLIFSGLRLKDIEIAGTPAELFENSNPQGGPGPIRFVIVKKDNIFYIIRYTYSNMPPDQQSTPESKADFVMTFDQILSTFKFIPPSPSPVSTKTPISSPSAQPNLPD